MRLIVARCEVRYSGRLNAILPEALRLIIVKADGSVLVHADSGGYKPLNWMTPPTVIEESPGRIVVRKRAGPAEDGWRSSFRRFSPTWRMTSGRTRR
jgi:endonuclease